MDLRLTTELVNYYPKGPAAYDVLSPAVVIVDFPTGHEVDAMYFGIGRWPKLLSGYSGFSSPDTELEGDIERIPDIGAIESLRKRGATHLIYSCRFERSADRCQANLSALTANRNLETISAERWLDAPVVLYRFKPVPLVIER